MFSPGKGTLLRLAGPCLVGLAMLTASGCSSKDKAVVSGKVTLKDGTPVSAGTVTFWSNDGRSGLGVLKSDGSYSIGDAPVGDVKVTVETPPATQGPINMPPPPPGQKGMPPEMIPGGGDVGGAGKIKIVPVPDKYKDQSTTPLTHTVTRGTQENVNFTLDKQ
jgi:hypothetical protein